MRTADVPRRIYLDHAATTPVRPEVRAAMTPFFTESFGNASSLHAEGRDAREALEAARAEIVETTRADAFDFVFVGSGTEADNSALVGAALGSLESSAAKGSSRFHMVTSAVEHPAILEARSLVEALGGDVTTVGAGSDGRVDPADVEAAFRADTRLVSIMAVNNETGALQDYRAIGRLARSRGVLFHTDAVQLCGKMPLELDRQPFDLVTISGHKIGAPKGVAGLFVRRGIRWRSYLRGGAQEGGLRAGTEHVAAAVGLARALVLAEAERPETMARLGALRDGVRQGLIERFPGLRVNGVPDTTVPTILNVSFPRVEGESLVKLLDALGIAVSTGSACNVGASKPSHVLKAMGLTDREVRGSIRLSFGRDNDGEDMEPILERVTQAAGRLERLAPTR